MEPPDPHVLIVVEKPDRDFQGDESKPWRDFVYYATNPAAAGPHTTPESPEWKESKIAENIWLLRMKTSTPFLGRLAAAAERAKRPYKFLIFPTEPEWIYPPPPGSPPEKLYEPPAMA